MKAEVDDGEFVAAGPALCGQSGVVDDQSGRLAGGECGFESFEGIEQLSWLDSAERSAGDSDTHD